MSNVPALMQERGISVEVFSALKNSIFPGATDDSVVMAWDYCAARGLDVMLKPVHLVGMSVKKPGTKDQYEWRDVVMPGIGLYRIQADRAGNYAGMDAPVFGDEIDTKLDGVDVSYPEWCEITVHKVVGDRVVAFTAREYWIENYATKNKDSKAPNAMWLKRPRGQIVKCTEAQVLRKGWPELGAQPTAEEMEGKDIAFSPPSSDEKKKTDAYLAFEIAHLQVMRDAAMDGIDSLTAAFSQLPKGELKTAFWLEYGDSLKAAADNVTVIDGGQA